ncbi:MAG: hypothetical protein KUG75_08990 [Pseudomonadales bacterium]|nr:hypothetical protein [Pseudomonadales bacterium]
MWDAYRNPAMARLKDGGACRHVVQMGCMSIWGMVCSTSGKGRAQWIQLKATSGSAASQHSHKSNDRWLFIMQRWQVAGNSL